MKKDTESVSFEKFTESSVEMVVVTETEHDKEESEFHEG
jgi:hypothetical protein